MNISHQCIVLAGHYYSTSACMLSHSPRQNLVIAKLKITKLLFSDRIYELVFVEVDNFLQ